MFLQEAISGEELDSFPLDRLSEERRNVIEADSFWCLSKFLDSIQDNYIFAQLGIQYKVNLCFSTGCYKITEPEFPKVVKLWFSMTCMYVVCILYVFQYQ